MATVEIYHPDTEGHAFVEEISLPHYLRAGWMLHSDFLARQQAEAGRAAQQDSSKQQAAPRAASKEK